MTERPEGSDEAPDDDGLCRHEELREPRVADLRDALSDFRESIARADAAFSHGVERGKVDDAYVAAMDAARVLAHTADAVLPLLTAELERADALQRDNDALRHPSDYVDELLRERDEARDDLARVSEKLRIERENNVAARNEGYADGRRDGEREARERTNRLVQVIFETCQPRSLLHDAALSATDPEPAGIDGTVDPSMLRRSATDPGSTRREWDESRDGPKPTGPYCATDPGSTDD